MHETDTQVPRLQFRTQGRQYVTDDKRLATVIGPEQGRRLRLAARVQSKPIGRLLTELLDAHLPSAAELADAIRNGASADDRASAS